MLVFLAFCVIMYALFAFVIWERNPALWSFGARYFLGCIVLVGGFLLSSIYAIEKNDIK